MVASGTVVAFRGLRALDTPFGPLRSAHRRGDRACRLRVLSDELLLASAIEIGLIVADGVGVQWHQPRSGCYHYVELKPVTQPWTKQPRLGRTLHHQETRTKPAVLGRCFRLPRPGARRWSCARGLRRRKPNPHRHAQRRGRRRTKSSDDGTPGVP